MSVSLATDSYPSIDRPVVSVTPAGSNVTEWERDALLAVAEVVVLAVILVMALLGNGLVLAVLPQLVWDARGRFPGPDFLCRLVKYLQVLGMFASSYMIVAMTMDRYYAICCPLQAHRSWTTQRRNSFILLAWGLSLLLSLPQVFIFSRSEVAPGVYECWGNFAETWGLQAYVTWMTVAIFILPVLIITVCQVQIFREIHNNLYLKSERRLSSLPPSRRDSQRGGGGGGGGGGRGRSSVSLYVSPLIFNNPGTDTSFDPGSTYQHLPMGPLRSDSIASHCDLHNYTTVHTAELQPDVLPDPAAPSAVCPPPRVKAPPARGGEVTAAMSKTVRMTLVIVLVYSLCWAPFFSVQLSVSPELRLLLLCRAYTHRRGSLPSDSTSTHNSNY
ncbi:vasopressin V2 receptor-like [Scomber scombrus]|uniref:Vasopressin V2 receptor-like n=1 Tax=Scomber scombrus TaxID=13677 RepID=A0AAV1PMW3_SCOSC